jgi:hypothetical protein
MAPISQGAQSKPGTRSNLPFSEPFFRILLGFRFGTHRKSSIKIFSGKKKGPPFGSDPTIRFIDA